MNKLPKCFGNYSDSHECRRCRYRRHCLEEWHDKGRKKNRDK